MGIEVLRLEGGYRAYREFILRDMERLLDGPRKGAPLPKVKGNHTTKAKKGKGYINLRHVPIKEKHDAKGEEY